jgi:23S rRNA (pseudouridine1915-N3)-methyltransferase
MKLHIVTIGQPKLTYARQGWEEYIKRLGRFHQVRVSHLADKFANDTDQIDQAIGNAYLITLEVTGRQYSSPQLSQLLDKLALEAREVCFVIGGPDGLPAAITAKANLQWSLSQLTFPHDLAMVVLAETLYRSSTISAGHPYHRS